MGALSMFKQPRQLVILGICLLGAVYLVWLVASHSGSGVPDTAYYRMYVCSETGKSFRHKIQVGDIVPILSPFTGKETGYPAEACYWTPEGTIKQNPDWVILNGVLGKPGPTFCPICGRLVVGHNPDPPPGSRPPPTQSEYEAEHGRDSSSFTGSADLAPGN